MKFIRRAFVACAALWAVSTGAAFAAEFRGFDSVAFAEAQAAGRPILIDVAAEWCPVCRAQAPIIRDTSADSTFDNLIVFRIDYDDQRAAWRQLNVRRQATLIAFRGSRETGRLVAATDRAAIEGLMRSTIE